MYERVHVTSRVKECESAIDGLRRRQEGGTFDLDRRDPYTLTTLRDLAGVRVLAFPPSRLQEVNAKLTDAFADWRPDPVRIDDEREVLAFKYSGFCEASSKVRGEIQISKVRGEIQIVPALIGTSWEVEHAALYKPTLELKGVDRDPQMKARTRDVYQALKAFEDTFQDVLKRAIAKP